MKDSDAAQRAIEAAQAWGGSLARPRLIRNRENVVFKARLRSGEVAALRLHRMGYQQAAAIEDELRWMAQLSTAGFPCPTPLPTDTGALIHALADGQICSAISWIDAPAIGENGVPYPGTQDEHLALYRSVGELAARLHATTDALATQDFTRPHWSADGLLGEAPLWGRFWENPSLDPAERAELSSAREHAAQHLDGLPGLDQGLIHADLMQENILQNDQLWLIDFDDSGFGYRLYDLATALIQHAESPYLVDLEQAVSQGYAGTSHKADEIAALMPLFIMLRSMASCGWIMSRAPRDDPRQRFYADRALRCARRYAQTRTS